jgi:hypothetical protein
MKKMLLAACLLATVAGFAREDGYELDDYGWSPFGLGIFCPLQLPGYESDICGLRFNLLYGSNQRVYGLDLGVSGLARGPVYGLEAQLFNWNEDVVSGLQLGAIANVTMYDVNALQLAGFANVGYGAMKGLSIAGGINWSDTVNGVQIACLGNRNNDNSAGVQLAFVNTTRNTWTGGSVGVINYADNLVGVQLGVINFVQQFGSGVQIGVFNAAQQFSGLQVGVLNMICTGYTPLLPIANMNF